jgi:hypothetical protein
MDDQLIKLDTNERQAVLSSANKAKNQDYMNTKEPRTTASNQLTHIPLAALRQPFGDEENTHKNQMRYGSNTKSSALPLSTHGTESKLSGNYPRMIHPVINDS